MSMPADLNCLKHQRKLRKILKYKKHCVKVDSRYVTKLKRSILSDVTKGGVRYTRNASNNAIDTSTSSIISTTCAITISSDAYIYMVQSLY